MRRGVRLKGERIVHLELQSCDRDAQGLEQLAPRRPGLNKGWVG